MSDNDESRENKDSQDYTGENDRRRRVRRSGKERRDMVRFEPDKDDRRSGGGRRKGEGNKWDYTI